jgi:hypothetical protein
MCFNVCFHWNSARFSHILLVYSIVVSIVEMLLLVLSIPDSTRIFMCIVMLTLTYNKWKSSTISMKAHIKAHFTTNENIMIKLHIKVVIPVLCTILVYQYCDRQVQEIRVRNTQKLIVGIILGMLTNKIHSQTENFFGILISTRLLDQCQWWLI